MGSSGLLLVGIVLLWAFGAVPHWVQRRERLASAWAAEATEEELRLLERRSEVTAGASASSAGLLPRTARRAAPVPAARTAPAPARAQAPAAARPGALAPLLLLGVTAVVALLPAVLAVAGVLPLLLAPAGLLGLAASAVVLRRRAVVRARVAARARAAAAPAWTPRLVPTARPAERPAASVPAARQHVDLDERRPIAVGE